MGRLRPVTFSTICISSLYVKAMAKPNEIEPPPPPSSPAYFDDRQLRSLCLQTASVGWHLYLWIDRRQVGLDPQHIQAGNARSLHQKQAKTEGNSKA